MSPEEFMILGSCITMFIILFAIIAFVDGSREALIVIGLTLGFIAGIAGIMAFWYWLASVVFA